MQAEYSGKHKIVATKNFLFLFCFLVFSGKLGEQSLRVRAAISFFLGITVFVYQNKNPVDQLIYGRHFRACLKYQI